MHPSSSAPIQSIAEDHSEQLAPPKPTFHIGGDSETDFNATHRSRPSRTGSSSFDSPPTTPRSLAFTPATNPFSPPASVRGFSTPSESPLATPAFLPATHYPFPDPNAPRSGITSMANSVADLSRTTSTSQFASRPATAEHAFSRNSSFLRPRESFTSPPPRPLTIYSTLPPTKVTKERPKSTMLVEGSLQKPWVGKSDRQGTIAYYLTYAVAFLGIGFSALKIIFDWRALPMMSGNLCPVLDTDFSSDQGVFGDDGVFFREVDMSGFGNGEFEMTTNSPNNSFIHDGALYILPTLTEDSIGRDAILDGHVYNITDCTFNITRGVSYTQSSTNDDPFSYNTTSIAADNFDATDYFRACSAVSNATEGRIINPVQSARLSTRKTASIRYGKVEVRAKLPTGDWMWPAIWMLPVDNTYGAWPLSGEIDIMEARGNGRSYPKQGSNYVRGSLNWGPITWLNAVSKTYGWWTLRRGKYSDDFHTYSIEWTEDFIRIYVDSRLHRMFETKMKQSFWDRGDFPTVVQNGSESIVLQDPWVNGTRAAPFDQRFFLILDVGVGGTNGWFPDGTEKPWLDGSQTAMKDFYLAKDEWLPSWPENPQDRAFVIDSVKMWQQC